MKVIQSSERGRREQQHYLREVESEMLDLRRSDRKRLACVRESYMGSSSWILMFKKKRWKRRRKRQEK